jgi:hypothetical protein
MLFPSCLLVFATRMSPCQGKDYAATAALPTTLAVIDSEDDDRLSSPAADAHSYQKSTVNASSTSE